MPIGLHIVSGGLCATTVELKIATETPGPAKPKPLLRSPAQKSLLTPELDKSKVIRGHM